MPNPSDYLYGDDLWNQVQAQNKKPATGSGVFNWFKGVSPIGGTSGNPTPYAPGVQPSTNFFSSSPAQQAAILPFKPKTAAPAAPKPATSTGRANTASRATNTAVSSLPVSTSPIVETPVAPPIVPKVSEDAVYQAQMAGLAKALADYETEQKLGASQYDTAYNDSLAQLGWGNGDWLPRSGNDQTGRTGYYQQALANNEEDFAGRGMLGSGLFGKSQTDLATDFAKRKSDYDTARTDFLTGQGAKKKAYENENQTTQIQAMLEAVARLAGKYNVPEESVVRP